MARLMKKRSQKTGLPPGTVIHIGEVKTEKVRITLMDYNEQNYREKELTSLEDCQPNKDPSTVTWINIDGLHEVALIEKIGQLYELHSLTLEDIVHTAQRPKVEDYNQYLYAVLQMYHYSNGGNSAQSEQISLVLGPHFVISFQECIGDVFDPVRDRIRKNKGRLRKMPADYLFYSLLDSIVDGYFVVLEKTSEKIEALQDEVIVKPNGKILHQTNTLKREMILFRKSAWPVREMINSLLRSESKLIQPTTGLYLKDVYDHAIQVIDTTETFQEMLTGILDVYLSSVSNKMNAVMKVLTIIATIFIPLTFLAGVYGMNFKYMPELQWRWAYPAVWAVMSITALVMLLFFRKKNWL